MDVKDRMRLALAILAPPALYGLVTGCHRYLGGGTMLSPGSQALNFLAVCVTWCGAGMAIRTIRSGGLPRGSESGLSRYLDRSSQLMLFTTLGITGMAVLFAGVFGPMTDYLRGGEFGWGTFLFSIACWFAVQFAETYMVRLALPQQLVARHDFGVVMGHTLLFFHLVLFGTVDTARADATLFVLGVVFTLLCLILAVLVCLPAGEKTS